MKKKPRESLRKPILRDFVLVTITDPAEQAALDRWCHQAEKVLSVAGPDSEKPRSAKRRRIHHANTRHPFGMSHTNSGEKLPR